MLTLLDSNLNMKSNKVGHGLEISFKLFDEEESISTIQIFRIFKWTELLPLPDHDVEKILNQCIKPKSKSPNLFHFNDFLL